LSDLKRPLILLTNDDGIHSPGLRAAAAAVCDLGDLLIVAPKVQQTGMGRAIPPIIEGVVTVENLQVGCLQVVAYAITGSPAQAVTYGVLALADRRPDLVVSGINYGENLGTSVTVSGTVGAALHAAELGIPGLAASLEVERAYHYNHGHGVDWSAAAHFTRHFARVMLSAQLPADMDVLKIDVPAEAAASTPWRLTRQSRQSYYRVLPPAGRAGPGPVLPLGYEVHIDWDTLAPDSDIWAFARDRVVAVTPLSQDLTARADFAGLGALLRGV
jgi:5'-nucleotidase